MVPPPLGTPARPGKSIFWAWRRPGGLRWWRPRRRLAMHADSAPSTALGHPTDWVATVRELGPRFAARAAAHDAHHSFLADNYADARERRVFSAGVPAELGGGGASHRELCDMLRTLAHSCGSTALALAMHTHILASTVWRWRHASAPVDAFLGRVAAEELILVSSGGSELLARSRAG